MSSRWRRAIAELSAQGDAARAAAQRVQDVPSGQRTTAAAISSVAETDYLRSASTLLRAHLADRRPPRRLSVARVWPCLRDVWKDWALDRRGGVWRAVPRNAALVRMRSAPSDPLLAAVIDQAEALQASHPPARRARPAAHGRPAAGAARARSGALPGLARHRTGARRGHRRSRGRDCTRASGGRRA